jgi:alkylation response protein AidB-like acyl-CoA dehydrogenase
MDMTLSEAQRDLVALAARILGDAGDRGTSSAELWTLLSGAGLLGIAVPEELGGLGLGFTEVGLLLEEAGRAAAAVPLLDCATATAVVRDLDTGERRDTLLTGLAAGQVVVGIALGEPAGDPLTPLVCAAGDHGQWTLHGTKLCAQSDPPATHLLVSAHVAGVGPRLLLLDADRFETGPGQVSFDGVPIGVDDVLGDLADPGAVPLAVHCARAAACSVMAGAMSRVVRLTAEYAASREQFGRPIGSFQAVGQRAADAFTAAWAIELTARQACWQLAARSAGPDLDAAVASAKYTAATAGAEVIRAAHHLHGGIGLDRDYPLHRYTTLAKKLELLLGGAAEQAVLLGDLLAAAAIRDAEPAVATGGE